jgi:transglutaminase-like putative cysteine protease
MAHDAGSSPRGQRLLALGAVCALAVATAAAFGRVFSGGGSVLRLMGVALASALLAASLERRNLVLATLVSAAGLLVVVGVVVFPKTTLYGLPTIDTLGAIRDAAGQIGREADAQVAPTPALAPLFLAAVTALWAAVFSAHALAIRAGSPLLSLLPPVALVAFADTVLEESERPLYGVLFLATALVIVFIDGLRRVQRWGPTWVWPGARGGLTSATGRGARRVAAMALGVATLVPLTLPGFGTSAVIDLSGGGSGDSIRVNPLVSIQSSLNRSDPVELFTVDAPVAAYWRTVSLDTFDGVTWKATQGAPPQEISSTTPLSDERLFSEQLDQAFTVGSMDLTVSGVPAAYPATHVEYPGALTYDPDLEMLRLDDGTMAAGTTYRVQSSPVQPPPEQLETVVFPSATLNPRYTSIPANLPPQITTIAEQWVANETSAYGQILAIQDHLRGPDFRYDATVPPRDDQFTLLDFLQTTKRGFCQQYASAMAIMLRTLGYPTRVAVGFTQGDRSDADGLWHVTTDNAHAWVEVLFPTYGWLAFEPTPGRTNPVANSYDDPATVCHDAQGDVVPCPGRNSGAGGGGPGRNAAVPPGQRANVDTRKTGGAGTLPPGAQGGRVIAPEPFRFPTGLVLGVAGALALLVLLLTPPVRAARRRARLRRAGPDPRSRILAIYDVFDSKAGAMGWARRLGETLQEYRRRLDASGLVSGDAMVRLTALAGRAAYAAESPEPADAAEAARTAESTLRDLQRGTPLGRRILGWYLPERPPD